MLKVIWNLNFNVEGDIRDLPHFIILLFGGYAKIGISAKYGLIHLEF